jgi:hypothetical protein
MGSRRWGFPLLSPLSAPNRPTEAVIFAAKMRPRNDRRRWSFRFEVESSLRVISPFADIIYNGATGTGEGLVKFRRPDCRQPSFTPQLTRLQKPLFFGLKTLFVVVREQLTRRHGNQLVEQSLLEQSLRN